MRFVLLTNICIGDGRVFLFEHYLHPICLYLCYSQQILTYHLPTETRYGLSGATI